MGRRSRGRRASRLPLPARAVCVGRGQRASADACLPRRAPAAGIRTGYCGSLTTFASWVLQLMREAIESNQVRRQPALLAVARHGGWGAAGGGALEYAEVLCRRPAQWMNAVLGFFVGLYCALCSYVLGMHAALAVDRRAPTAAALCWGC